MRSSPWVWLGWLLVVSGVTVACLSAARAGAVVGECSASRVHAQPPAASLAIARAADGAYVLSRADLERALRDPAALTGGVRLEPVVRSVVKGAVKTQQLAGIRAASVDATSPLAGVLHAGDVLERVNGAHVGDGKALSALVAQLRSTSEVVIQGTRRGVSRSWTVRIVG